MIEKPTWTGWASALVAAVVMTLAASIAPAAGAAVGCAATAKPLSGARVPAQSARSISLVADAAHAAIVRNVGNDRRLVTVREPLTASKPVSVAAKDIRIGLIGDIARSDGGEDTFPDATFSQPVISADGQVVQFDVCLDPLGVSAGEYSGKLRITGPSLRPVDIPITVKVKDVHGASHAIIAAIIGALIGVLLKAVTEIARGNSRLPRERWRAISLVAVVVVAVAICAGTAINSTYATNTTFNGHDFTTLFAVGTVAFGAATAATQFIDLVLSAATARQRGADVAADSHDARGSS